MFIFSFFIFLYFGLCKKVYRISHSRFLNEIQKIVLNNQKKNMGNIMNE